MATRKVFIDDYDNQITSYFDKATDDLIIEISYPDESTALAGLSTKYKVVLPKKDAKEFILELYRLGRKIK